jgi:acyl-coenzyme A synthetase/AMP-(fatty) acid ligase
MSNAPIWTAFADRAAERPGATALVWRDEKISYDELYQLAGRAHAMIDRLAVESGEIIGVPATKSPATIATALACLRARLPVMLPSVTLPSATQDQLFTRAGCRYVVRADLSGDHAFVDFAAPDWPDQSSSASMARLPDDIGFILTTSGSTGLPKLVPLAVGAVARFTDWAAAQFDIGRGTTVLNYAPLNFDLCFLDVWTTLQHGGQVVLVDPDAATNGAHLLSLIADHEVNVVQAVPMCYRLIIDAAADRSTTIDSVRHAIFTGDHMPPRCLAELPGLFPRARLYNIYGCTETNDSFLHEIDAAAVPDNAVPLGTPLPGVHALIDGDDGHVVTGEGRGELLVATPFQTPGYLGHAGDNRADRFVDRPNSDGSHRYFRTGDIVRRDADGQVHLEGRNDFQVKVRGTRVNSAEVEQALLDHDGVLEAVVVAVPDPLAGHLLHAVVRRAPQASVNSLVLRQHCAERLPLAAVPSVVRVVDEPLPKTSTGKVDRQAFDLVNANRSSTT